MSYRSSNINNLQLLCSRKLCSIKDVQAEAVLAMVLSLLGIHIQSLEKDEKIITGKMSEVERLKINEFCLKLFMYLNSRVMNPSKIEKITKESSLSPQAFMKARLVEPIGYYYNNLSNSFNSRFFYVNQLEDEKKYIPELLAIYLILDFKELTGYSFEKYDFFKDLNFNEIIDIYLKIHFEEKKEKGIKLTEKELNQTVVKKMINISLYMIEKLISSDYSKDTRNLNKRQKAKKGKR